MHIKWRGLELPSAVHVDKSTLSGTYGKFVAEPFERGFGTTIGNSLRRFCFQPGRQCDHANQGSRRSTRIHYHPWHS